MRAEGVMFTLVDIMREKGLFCPTILLESALTNKLLYFSLLEKEDRTFRA